MQPSHAAMLFTTLNLADRSEQDGAKLQEKSSASGLNRRGHSCRDPAPTQGARGPALPCTPYMSAMRFSVGEISAKMETISMPWTVGRLSKRLVRGSGGLRVKVPQGTKVRS